MREVFNQEAKSVLSRRSFLPFFRPPPGHAPPFPADFYRVNTPNISTATMQVFVRGAERTYVLDLTTGASFSDLRAEVASLEGVAHDLSLSVGGRPIDADTDLFSLPEGATLDVTVPLKGGKVSSEP